MSQNPHNAAHEQTPNSTDLEAARFKDLLELRVNEQYRREAPGQIPPTFTLIHGKDFIKLVKADGALQRDAIYFINRITGDIFPALTWEHPKERVVANVFEHESWRHMAMRRIAKAKVEPVRQRTQYSCMAASMAMCLRALDHDVTEDEVNRVMGARPMQGAAWEQALACAQHYGCRATLTMPSTVEQLKAWTDAGTPIMIAWNPEGRPWSHASTVYNVTDELPSPVPANCTVVGSNGPWVWVADPNIPNPKKTTRIVSEEDFYGKWYEKFPDYLVRRPACAIEREITTEGQNVRMASRRHGTANTSKVIYAGVMLDKTSQAALELWWTLHTGQPVLPQHFMHHMTIQFKPSEDEIQRMPVGQTVKLKVIGWAGDERIQAVAVRSSVPSANGIPHITVATDGKAKPFESNALLARGMNSTSSGITLTGRVGLFTPQGIIY